MTSGNSTSPTALVLEHDDYSYPGTFGDHARARGLRLHDVRLDTGASPPDPREFDLVMVMGSIWSVYDDQHQWWIQPELEAIRTAVAADIPVLGVCFGAQALSAALGGTVYRMESQEVGWCRIDTAAPDLIDPGPWFEWHQDSFTLPDGATVLASNAAGIQAYGLGRHLAVQFHPEVSPPIIREWMADGMAQLEQAGIDPEALVAETDRLAADRMAAAEDLLDRFLSRAVLARP